MSSQNIEHLVNIELVKTINSAVTFVPYYRNLFKKLGLSEDDIKSIDDLTKIPLLDKDLIRSNLDQFINERYKKNKLICIHTTGTTGTPLNIYCDADTRQKNYAFYTRFLNNNHISSDGRRATFGGRIIAASEQRKPPFWRYSLFQKNLLFSSYHLSDLNIPFYIEKLKKFKPDYIDTYPSSLYTIAAYARERNIDLKGITKGITTSAETLFPDQRTVIESVFGVTVCDQYGAAEMCIFVGQCKEGSYHIHTDYGIVEVLKEDGTRAEPGEEGQIVCTGFINPVMPLIRYCIGDRGVLASKQCSCGSVFPVLETLLGRIDDVIVTPDGKKVGRLSPVLKGFPVKEAQYVQRSKGVVEIHIVKDTEYNEGTEKRVIEEIRKRLGAQISLQIIYKDYIPRSSRGKLRSIISLYKHC